MSKEDLLSALQALHHHPDGNVKKQASTWLQQWGYTVEAWSICDNVLHDVSSTLEARIFCAQTLRTKVDVLLAIKSVLCIAERCGEWQNTDE